MKKKELLKYKGLKMVLSNEADEEIINLLSKTVLGSKGGMRYILMSVKDRIKAYTSNIRFISLYNKEKLTGTVGLCYREVSQGTNTIHGTYLRYLAMMLGFQSDEDTGQRRERKDDNRNSDSMKSRLLDFFRKPAMLDFPGYEKGDKNVVYAYVESMNERSKNIIHQIGFQYIRSFLTVAFSRFNPSADSRADLLPADKRTEMLGLLRDYYSKYSFYSDENTFYNNSYYVIKENNRVVAGLSAVPTDYNIVNVPGVWGWIFMNILHRLPWFKRLFKPGVFRFLVFGHIYVAPGHEKDLEKLMESVCAKEKINTALTWADDRSELFDMFRTRINMGALNRMLNAKPGLVYAGFINLGDKEKEFFYDNPAFISGFDFT